MTRQRKPPPDTRTPREQAEQTVAAHERRFTEQYNDIIWTMRRTVAEVEQTWKERGRLHATEGRPMSPVEVAAAVIGATQDGILAPRLAALVTWAHGLETHRAILAALPPEGEAHDADRQPSPRG